MTSSTLAMAGTSRTIGHLYDADGNRVRITHPDGGWLAYEYDGLGRFKLLREDSGDALVTLTYDSAGRRSGLTSGGTASGYGYDPAGRLQSLTHNLAGTSADQVIGLGYNPASQVVSRSSSNDSYAWAGSIAVSRDYARNGQNQYTGTISNGTPSASFGYDLNGNLTSDGSTTFAYDVENRLVSASGARTAALVHDPLGRLFQASGGPAGITQFLYDDDALIGEYNSTGTMLSRYIHGTGKGVDDPLIWYDNPNGGWRRALVADQQGSIIAVADMHGTPLAINAYDEYGIPGAANQGRFQYTGQAWIPELGMFYYKARIYSPTLGRFMQTDPIGYEGGINLYAYVDNDPVNEEDPTGKCPWCVGAIIGGLEEVAIQTLIEGKSLKQVDWVDVGISAAAGATGYGLVKGLGRVMRSEATIVRSQRAVQRARASAQRAGGVARRTRAAAQIRRAQTAAAGARGGIQRTVAATAAVAAVKAGTQKATPPVQPRPKTTEKDEHPLSP